MQYATDISKVAAKDSVKHELQYVNFSGNRYAATDSFRLIEIETKHEPLKEDIMIHAEALVPLSTIDGQTRTLTLPAKHGPGAVLPIPKNPGVFPNYKMVMPTKESIEDNYISIDVNASYLLDLVQIAKKMKGKRFRLTLSVHKTDPKKALQLKAVGFGEMETMTALLMPLHE